MPLRTVIQPIIKDVQALLEELTDPKAQSLALAEFARDEIEDAKATNRQALGYTPAVDIYVDGTKGASLESVRPRGVIVADFALVDEVLVYIDDQLKMHSPVLTGRYRASHLLFADGNQVSDPELSIPQASEYVFVNAVPYARKIERGSSSQAPDGVYQVVAVLAQRKFRNLAKISFSYRTFVGAKIVGGREGNKSSDRNPAIIVRGRV
jgi:hypothetical protein